MRYSRREFLRHALCATSYLADLRKVAAAAQSNGDYKALVCLFLFGGNDGDNTLIPRGNAEYTAYAAVRAGLAIPQGHLLPIAPLTGDGRQYGLHPSLPELQDLFARRRLAVLANVGALLAPLTKAEYVAGRAPVPPHLFAHNEQQTQWMTAWADGAALNGWGGRVADLVSSLNTNAQLSMCISLAGSNLFQVGNAIVPYQVSPQGVFTLTAYQMGNDPQSVGLREILGLGYTNLFDKAYRDVLQRALDKSQLLSAALNAAPAPSVVFPATDIGRQLKMAARLMAVRTALGLRRQIFFCSADGYDTHGAQLDTHARLLQELSQALGAFYAATEALGIAANVTTFTVSDFGRTYVQNGKGTDHGWGNVQFILGGAVKGGDIYGKVPVQRVNGPDDAGRGSWIPTTSVDEYAATLALWFGVNFSDLPTLFPNIGRFSTPNLGFLL